MCEAQSTEVSWRKCVKHLAIFQEIGKMWIKCKAILYHDHDGDEMVLADESWEGTVIEGRKNREKVEQTILFCFKSSKGVLVF